MSGATAAQIGKIHAIAKQIGLSEDERRNVIAASAGGKRSSKDLSRGEAIIVIAHFERLSGGARRASQTATGKYAGLLKALWMDAWNLGVSRSPDDASLIAFVQRQTHVDHTRFLTDWEVARPAIEGLKGWIARKGGVQWPADRNALSVKFAILAAQCARLETLGAKVPRLSVMSVPAPTDADLHRAQQLLGRRIRTAMAAKPEVMSNAG